MRCMTNANPVNQLTRPAQLSKLPPDVIVLWDACELPPNYDRQYVCGYEVDGALYEDNATTPQFRWRGLNTDPTDFQVSDQFPIDPGPNVDSGLTGTRGNIRWRHGKNKDQANFLFADGSVKSMFMTKDYGLPSVRGEVLRRYFRPRPPVGFQP